MVPRSPVSLEFDKEDRVNAGIINDELAGYREVALFRRIVYLSGDWSGVDLSDQSQ